MGKNFYFLAGLHRSGNTVLSAILNQHPEIYVSPLSPVIDYMWQTHVSRNNFEASLTNPNDYRSKNVVSSIIDNYYKDSDKKIIIDRHKSWSNPDNVRMLLEYLPYPPKIMVTVRPLRECIASLIKIYKEELLETMDIYNIPIDQSMSENDNIASFLLNSNFSDLSKHIFTTYSDPELKQHIHLVKYEDILDKPQETLDQIYKFLEIESFTHDFNNIQSFEKQKDIENGFPENLHEVRGKLEFSGLDPEEYMSKEMIEECNLSDLFYN